MGKKFTISTYVKRIFLFISVCLIAFTLASCDSNKRGKGSLDLNATYASSGNLSVTVGDLYDEFRFNGNTYLEDRINKFLFDEEISYVKTQLENNDEFYVNKINDKILEAIFSTSDEDELKNKSEKELKKAVDTYVDTMQLKGYNLTADQLLDQDNNVLKDNLSIVYDEYILSLAEYRAAYKAYLDKFEKNGDNIKYYTEKDGKYVFADGDDDLIKTSDVVDYYKDNYEDKTDVNGILVRTISSTEAANILKAFGIKTYNNYWYQIDLDDEALESKTKYDEHYNDTSIDPTAGTGSSSIEESGAGMATILKIMVEIYNYEYQGFRNKIVYDDQLSFDTFEYEGPAHLKYYNYIKAIIEKDYEYRLENSEDGLFTEEAQEAYLEQVAAKIKEQAAYGEDGNYTVFTNERLEKYNSSLATYVYDTLATSAEEGETYVRYTSSARSYGSYYYFFFKISQEESTLDELYEEVKDEDDNTTYEFTNKELLDEIIEKIIEERITSDSENDIYSERAKEAKIKIYDSIVELEFMQSTSAIATNYSKTRKSSKDKVAYVKYDDKELDITVDEFYAYHEAIYGARFAMNLLFNQMIKTLPVYQELEKDYDKYEESLKTMLYYFSNDYYSSYGYSSTLGKYRFLMLLYHSSKSDEIIRNNMMVQDAKSKFLNNFENFFTESEFLGKLKLFSEKSYNDYYSMGATQIQIYVDYDEDDEPDALNAEISLKCGELMNEIIDYVNSSTDAYSTALSNFISEYNATARVDDNNHTNPTTNEYNWASYRAKGLYVKTSTLSGLANDSDNDEALLNIVKTYYENDLFVKTDLGLTSNVLTSENFELDNYYSKLLLTSATLRENAKYEFEDAEEFEDLYKQLRTAFNDYLLVYNFEKADFETTTPSDKVILAYMYEYLLLGSVTSLPDTVDAYLDAYFLPLLTKYSSSASQYTIMKNVLGTITFAKDNDARNNMLKLYIESNQRQSDNYTNQYATWWTTLYGPLKSN